MLSRTAFTQIIIILIAIIVGFLYFIPDNMYFDEVYNGKVYDMEGELVKELKVELNGLKSSRLIIFKDIYFKLRFDKNTMEYQEGFRFKPNTTVRGQKYVYIPKVISFNGYNGLSPNITHLFISEDMSKVVFTYRSINNRQYIFMSGNTENKIDINVIRSFVGL